jgi:isocitrate lyase
MSSNGANPANQPADQAAELERQWREDPKWSGIERTYSAADVLKLRPSLQNDNAIARHGAERLRRQLQEMDYVHTFGAVTGAQAVQMAKAGLNAIYVSGWQVAADANQANQTFPDQSLYPSTSVPNLVKRLNNALMRADQIDKLEGKTDLDYYLPIMADAEAGFGGPIHAFELMKNMIEAGAAGVHYEDQLAAEKKCGHMGGKVLVPTSQMVRTLEAARLAADVLDVPTMLFARTDALAATLITNDIDERDREFVTGERTAEGYFVVRDGMDSAISRGLAYAPYADLIWCETGTPDLDEAQRFAEAIHAKFPDKQLAYNCSPSFNWKLHLDDATIATFQRDLAQMGYRFQFITLAGWHTINYHTFNLARGYAESGMKAYVELQEGEFAAEPLGYTATKHQREAGTSYFDEILLSVTGGQSSTTALSGSTEEAQFAKEEAGAPAS